MSGGLLKEMQKSIREIVFGLEDSFVSTLGAITGIAAGTGSTFVVILSGVVLIFAESLSMAAGSYLSSKSANEVFNLRLKQDTSRILQERVSDNESIAEMLKRKKFNKKEMDIFFKALSRERHLMLKEMKRSEARFAPSLSTTPFRSGFVMGIFYFFGGMFPLFFYFILPVKQAIFPSIVLTAFCLFLLGVWKSKIVGGNWWKGSLEMVSISLSAAVIGFFLGRLVALLFGVNI